MKNTTLLERLQTMQQDDANNAALLRLIEDVKEEINRESLPETTTKKQYQAARRFLSKKWMQRRPILQFTHIEQDEETGEDIQVFTDSYCLFRFKGDGIIHQLPKTTDPEAEGLPEYPKTAKLCGILQGDGLNSYAYDVASLKKTIQTTPKDNEKRRPIDIVFNSDRDERQRLDGEMLRVALDILGLKNSDIVLFRYYPNTSEHNKPVGIITKDRAALLLPLRNPNA